MSSKTAVNASYYSIVVNVVLAIAKALGGVLGNSYALIADAIESTTDIFSSGLVLFGLKYASRPADKKHPYGYGRIEPLITFVVVGFLITSATVIAYESIRHIRTPHHLPKAWTLLILGPLIIWKEISFHVVMKKAKETNSSSLKADAWHHRSDAITSVAAFIGISIALFMGKGYESADDWAALFASGFIVYNCYHIFRPALSEMMDEHTHHELVDAIRIAAEAVEGIVETEKCHVRKTGMKYHVDLHVSVDAEITVREGHEIAHKLKDTLMRAFPQLADVLIHVEPFEEIRQ